MTTYRCPVCHRRASLWSVTLPAGIGYWYCARCDAMHADTPVAPERVAEVRQRFDAAMAKKRSG